LDGAEEERTVQPMSSIKLASAGVPLPSSLTGGGPNPIGCQKANLTQYADTARSIAQDEQSHVRFLRSALGNNAVQCPEVNIGSAFATAANDAFNKTVSPSFNPYENDLLFLHGAFIFEDVGVSAYQGAASYLANSSSVLTAAAGILGVEGYHAGAIRQLLINQNNVTTPFGAPVYVVVDAIANLRDRLSGQFTDNGIGNITSVTLAPVDSNGIVKPLTPQQVLSIVYGGKSSGGLFFPNGLNGAIH
jgi:hypothetical protein